MNRFFRSGFTVLELLVVIAIIGILSVIIFASTSSSREQAKEAVAKQQLNQLRTGIFMLVNDTGKGPGGCNFGSLANPEVGLNMPQAGLVTAPPVGPYRECEWTAAEVAKWQGPYFRETIDPWGRTYYLDPDYIPWRNCAEKATEPVTYVIYSIGPDRLAYSCDDIFLKLR